MSFPGPPFRTYVALTALLLSNEVLSYLGYIHRGLGNVLFVAIVAITFAVSWYRIEDGLVVLFAELFVGGKGYLYSITVANLRISIRIALFVVIVLVWVLRHRARWKGLRELPTVVRRGLIVFALFVVWGIVHGLLAGHGIGAVYFDANAYLFYGLLVVLLLPSLNWERLGPRLIALLAATATVLGIKSIVSLGIFAHLTVKNLALYYRWIRNTGVGEIAYINGNAYRVFFQSQVYGLLAFFVLAGLVLPAPRREPSGRWMLVPMTFGLTAVLISLSRSFWLGAAVAAVSGLALGWQRFRWTARQFATVLGVSALMLGTAYTLTSWALNFPRPFPPARGSQTARIIGERFATLGGEAAASSRLQLLRPLSRAVAKNPLLGAGFAQTVTYQSNDPRQLQSPSKGRFTTYAFEWGYLDIALKIGVLGMLAYVLALTGSLWDLWRRRTTLAFGFFLGLLGLMVVHLTTPYLNHPLGIGFVLLSLTLARYRPSATL